MGIMFKFLALAVGGVFVLVVAAIIIPCLSNSKDSANEASAASMTRRLAVAEIEYESSHGQYADIKALVAPGSCPKYPGAGSCVTDPMVATSSPASPRNDYYFIAQPGPKPGTLVVAALPVKFPHQSFCATEDGVIHRDSRKSSSGTPSYTGCKSLPALGS
jgi:hypothetical protein